MKTIFSNGYQFGKESALTVQLNTEVICRDFDSNFLRFNTGYTALDGSTARHGGEFAAAPILPFAALPLLRSHLLFLH